MSGAGSRHRAVGRTQRFVWKKPLENSEQRSRSRTRMAENHVRGQGAGVRAQVGSRRLGLGW